MRSRHRRLPPPKQNQIFLSFLQSIGHASPTDLPLLHLSVIPDPTNLKIYRHPFPPPASRRRPYAKAPIYQSTQLAEIAVFQPFLAIFRQFFSADSRIPPIVLIILPPPPSICQGLFAFFAIDFFYMLFEVLFISIFIVILNSI